MDKKALIKALRDTVQSASNSVASGVSAPVDLIAAGLRKVGLPIPQAPVGGSQWMENMGLTVPVEDGIPKMAGDFLGMIVPMAATAKAPQIAAAANKGLENLAAPRTLNTPGYGGQRGAIVWHGSPHKFDAFDASKIGTGEGAQAYGHGLYFAESPDVAGQYQRNLGGVEMRDKAGKVVPIPENVEWVAKDLAAAGGDYNKVRSQLAEHGKMYPWPAEVGTKYINELEAAGIKPADLGSLYKVDLPDEAIARMLDWDKPLSQQAPDVQRIINEELKRIGGGANTGERAYKELMFQARVQGNRNTTKAMRNNLEALEASKRLQELGIPGIRYLDAGSRATGGTSNFVVFPGEERLLRILERNGQPMGLMGAPKQTGLQELTTLNPTGSVFSNYDPISRAIAPLGKNITTLDKTMGGLADDTVTIYRGAPKTQKTINPGDFITTDAQLARDYAGTGHVISQKVRKKDILDDMLEPLGGEYIYRPAK